MANNNKTTNNSRAILLAAIELFVLFYVVLAIFGPTFRTIAILSVAILLHFSILGAAWWAQKKPKERFSNLYLIIGSIIITILLIDIAISMHLVSIVKATDIDVIPFQVSLLTRDNYLTTVLEKRYSGKKMSTGQASNFIKDNKVYEWRWITVETDEVGLRNPIGAIDKKQDVILMGDSFTFGYGTDQENIWSYQLAKKTSLNVYNIGVYGHGVTQQVELLNYLLKERGMKVSAHPVFILVVFEGNDLTDINTYANPIPNKKLYFIKEYMRRYFKGSLFYTMSNIMRHILHKKDNNNDLYVMYSSSRFGNMTFLIPYSEAINNNNISMIQTAQFFKNAGINTAFKRLKDLSDEYNATVVIYYCPTKSRVYGKYFNGHPKVPEQDYFRQLVSSCAENYGMKFVDLTIRFNSIAKDGGLLYWRDDTHLNNQGHYVLTNVTEEILRTKDNK